MPVSLSWTDKPSYAGGAARAVGAARLTPRKLDGMRRVGGCPGSAGGGGGRGGAGYAKRRRCQSRYSSTRARLLRACTEVNFLIKPGEDCLECSPGCNFSSERGQPSPANNTTICAPGTLVPWDTTRPARPPPRKGTVERCAPL